MLNNIVVGYINKNCESDRFKFGTLSNTRRSFAILDDKYFFLFKKFPVSNLKTTQDDIIKNQELDKHVIFVVYSVDEYWDSISKVQLQYFSTPTNLTFHLDITNFAEINKTIKVSEPKDKIPLVSVKKELIIKKKAE